MTASNQTTRARAGHEIRVLRAQLGAALQRNRLRCGLTQADVAGRADLSLKYVGQVERGEANTTIEVLERLAAIVGWNPFDPDNVQEPLSEGVRLLLLDDVQKMCNQLENMSRLLRALDPVLQPKVNAPAPPHVAAPRIVGRSTRGRRERETRR